MDFEPFSFVSHIALSCIPHRKAGSFSVEVQSGNPDSKGRRTADFLPKMERFWLWISGSLSLGTWSDLKKIFDLK
jgi:hypothetical protein